MGCKLRALASRTADSTTMRTDYSIKIGKSIVTARMHRCCVREGPIEDASARGYSTCYLLKVGAPR
jgi:hypothetical protein